MGTVLTLPKPMSDPESADWIAALSEGSDDATQRLYELLLRAARFEVGRRRSALDGVVDAEQLAADAAHDARRKLRLCLAEQGLDEYLEAA